jgi:adenosylcobinamide-phosphate synthase
MNYNLSPITYNLSSILVAYLLDLIMGDPQWPGHPTRIIGRLIGRLEQRLNVDSINKKIAGFILVILVVGATVLSVWSILKLAKLIHPISYYIASVLLIYFALSVKSLGLEAYKVYAALRKQDIKEARKNLSMIVARDTHKLAEPEIIRATVETVAESTMDGIIAPLFYTFLGGPVLVWTYKAINTLDSMIGYRSERFIEFGRSAAQIDAIVNFIPAKITSLLIFICGLCYSRNWSTLSRWTARYLLKGPQENSEATEATLAAVLGVQLGGLNFYNSVPMQKTLIGDNLYPLDIKHIKDGIRVAFTSSVLFMALATFLFWLVERG